jgi:hypothetical protein
MLRQRKRDSQADRPHADDWITCGRCGDRFRRIDPGPKRLPWRWSVSFHSPPCSACDSRRHADCDYH